MACPGWAVNLDPDSHLRKNNKTNFDLNSGKNFLAWMTRSRDDQLPSDFHARAVSFKESLSSD